MYKNPRDKNMYKNAEKNKNLENKTYTDDYKYKTKTHERLGCKKLTD